MRGSEPVTNPCSPEANLNAIAKLLEKLCSLHQIQEELVHLGIENVKACLFTEEVAATLTDSLSAISPNIGLETGSEAHMKTIGKCGTPSDVLRAVDIAMNYGMTPFVYFIYGLPGEDATTVENSLQIMRELSRRGVERIILYGFRPLPGSAFEGFVSPSPDDAISQELRSEAAQINRAKKERYIGKIVRGIASEPSWEKHGYTMVYPFHEGPIMTIQGGFSPGTMLNLKVTRVLSPGLVEAEVIRNEKI
jgi:hypothetical protein